MMKFASVAIAGLSLLATPVASTENAPQTGYVWTDLSKFTAESTIATGYGGCLAQLASGDTTQVRLQTCSTFTREDLTFTRDSSDRLVQKSTGKCIEWEGAANPTGGNPHDNVHLRDCSDSDRQQWYTDIPGTIKSRAAGNQCLEYYCTTGYCHVSTVACTGGANQSNRGQKWQSSDPPTHPPTTAPTTSPTTTPVVSEKPAQPGYVWTDLSLFTAESTIATGYGGCLAQETSGDTTQVRLQTCSTFTRGDLTFTRDSSERLVQKSTGLCIEWDGAANPSGGSPHDNVHLSQCSDSKRQQWYSDTSGTIKSRASGNQCLEYYCTDYCHVSTVACTGAANQSSRGQRWQSSDPPTHPPTSAPTTTTVVDPPIPKASASGDPHFTTWNGDKFDFHGGCDLVLVQNNGFAHGLGMNIHIRTKINTWWSYIEAAVVKIGDDTLEVVGGEEEQQAYYVNGRAGEKLQDRDMFHLSSGFVVQYRKIKPVQMRFRIDLGNGDAIGIETYKSFVSVNVKATKADEFSGAMGLMGSYPSGKKMARNGISEMKDAIEFGKEWQVTDSDGALFHNVEDVEGTVQYPSECAMPDNKIQRQSRRLGEATISTEDAALACASVPEADLDACIFDVMATGDKGMAGSF